MLKLKNGCQSTQCHIVHAIPVITGYSKMRSYVALLV